MSENVTHVAVCDDVARVAALHPEVPDAFKETLRHHLDLARLGAATRSADRWSAQIVAWARENWPTDPFPAEDVFVGDERGAPKDQGPRVPQKLAYVLGALTHRAADRLFKPIFQYCREQYGEDAGLDCSIHCDVLVFREVYGLGRGGDAPAVNGSGLPTARVNPYQAAVFQAPITSAGRELEAIFRTLWQRALIGMHTFSPDSKDMLNWLDRLMDAVQPFYLDLAQYQRIVEHPDPDKVRRYLEDTNAYDPQDQLIQVARRVQRGEAVTARDALSALEATTDASSRYARALKKGIGYVLGAAQLWRLEIDDAQAKTIFDVGVPERSLAFAPPALASTVAPAGAQVVSTGV